MKVCYILLNICLPYYSFIISTYTKTNGSISTFSFVAPISSPINLVRGSISFAIVAKIASTFSCSWIFYGFFLLDPLF